MRSSYWLPFLIAAASLVPATQAHAHAELMSTTPVAGRVVAPPGAVTLRFDDVVQLPPRALRITGPHGHAVSARASLPDPKTLQGSLARHLAAGRYAVRWRVVADDGHTVTGAFRFRVRAAGKPAAAAAPAPAPPPSRDGGTAAVLLTLFLSLVTIIALGVGLVRVRRERVAR